MKTDSIKESSLVRTEKSVSVKATQVPQDEDVIIGKHVYGNLYGIEPSMINEVEKLREVMLEAVKIAKMSLVEIKAWPFGGKKGGVSVIALIEESHMALHTWNEYNYATLDIYTCGEDSDPKLAFEHVLSKLKPQRQQMFIADRSQMKA